MNDQNTNRSSDPQARENDPDVKSLDEILKQRPVEIGGPKGPEPTRYGDWERKGRCIDF